MLLGPGINIKRSPAVRPQLRVLLRGPAGLAGVLGAAIVGGLQSQGVGASVKHFAANNQETDRLRVSADVDERTLREIYLPAFERVVTQAQPWTVMCAYNRVNGVYASQHRWLLTEVLRDEWGFDGLVVSDWGAVHDRVAALAAGLDLEMPPNLGVSDAAIVAAVRAGDLDEAVLDLAVARVLQLVDARRCRRATGGRRRSTSTRHHALARAAAAECAVLLKNDGDVLPLRPSRRRRGRGDRRVRPHPALPGRRQLPGQPDPGRRRPGRAARRAARRRRGRRSPPALALDDHRRRRRPGRRGGRRSPARPTPSCVFLGLPAADESEGFDRDHIDLPANQIALLRARGRGQPATRRRARQRLRGPASRLGAARPGDPRVLALRAGRPAARSPTCCSAAPTRPGRLAETLPLRLEDNPSFLQLPRRARPRPLRRGHLRRLPRLRRRRPRRSATRSATACPTPPSTTPTSTVDVTGQHEPATSPSP